MNDKMAPEQAQRKELRARLVKRLYWVKRYLWWLSHDERQYVTASWFDWRNAQIAHEILQCKLETALRKLAKVGDAAGGYRSWEVAMQFKYDGKYGYVIWDLGSSTGKSLMPVTMGFTDEDVARWNKLPVAIEMVKVATSLAKSNRLFAEWQKKHQGKWQ